MGLFALPDHSRLLFLELLGIFHHCAQVLAQVKARGLASPDLGETLAVTLHVHLNQCIRERKELV